MLVEFVISNTAPKYYQGACSAVSLKTFPYLSYSSPPGRSCMLPHPFYPPPLKNLYLPLYTIYTRICLGIFYRSNLRIKLGTKTFIKLK